MKVSLLTPTCSRPVAFALCERYMARQTAEFHEWVVADSGATPVVPTMGQVHLHRPMEPGARNLARNIIDGLDACTGDVVLIVEDDDAYLPGHIAACLIGLKRNPAYGCPRLIYFNVAHRCWVVMANRGAALCQTAIRRELVPELRAAAVAAYEANDFGIDGRFWRSRQYMATGSQTCVGLKGLPGTPGLGIGHRPKSSRGKRWLPDPELKHLRRLIGDDVENYLC